MTLKPAGIACSAILQTASGQFEVGLAVRTSRPVVQQAVAQLPWTQNRSNLAAAAAKLVRSSPVPDGDRNETTAREPVSSAILATDVGHELAQQSITQAPLAQLRVGR